MDGLPTYYGPIYTNCEGKNELLVHPNPNTGSFVVTVNTDESIGESAIVVYDVSGKMVLQKQLTLVAGTNSVSFDDTNLVRGTYFVAIEGIKDDLLKPVKLIIQ